MRGAVFNNRADIVKDDLVRVMREGDRVSVAAGVFSMYAYQELREQLEQVDSFRFIFTEQAFTQQQTPRQAREFYIPRLAREQGLTGTDFEIKLKSELTQKAVARECADWIRRKARFKSAAGIPAPVAPGLALETQDDVAAYLPMMEGFTTGWLGVTSSAYPNVPVLRQDAASSRAMLASFNEVWDGGALTDVTESVIESISAMYRENPPELVYYFALYRIFREFLDNVSEDVLPNEANGFKESAIWQALYPFQRDAALAIINKLEMFDGCILADSVGLGKTFTALAVIKYYLQRHKDVLVLCPKKLGGNWLTYRGNARNNPFATDKMKYDVMYHTDLTRKRGLTATGLDLQTVNWGNFDLVVIDESHNFRSGLDTAAATKEGRENRYAKLLNRVMKEGVNTKVLMLSATPVNTRFRDLRNQLELAYKDDSAGWSEKLGLSSNIEDVFRRAQAAFNAWSRLDIGERTTQSLSDMLEPDFFTVLDQVTVARSRRHIQRFYDTASIGAFPRRLPPVSLRPKLTTDECGVTYGDVYVAIERLTLAAYMPSHYVLPSRVAKYAGVGGNLTAGGRETGMRCLMASGLLKRLESSVASFRLTLGRMRAFMDGLAGEIERYRTSLVTGAPLSAQTVDAPFGRDGMEALADEFDFEDADLADFEVGRGGTRFQLADMDWKSWGDAIASDLAVIDSLLALVQGVDPEHDGKLAELKRLLAEKVANPINAGNRKVLVFTAFADTADYLYEHLGAYAHEELGMEVAEVTGASSGVRTTAVGVHADMSEVISCFSPVSKERDAVYPELAGADIDLLIATDCISEGQNLQDCDYQVNYDIHWNPVRVVQRFGRVDRIGSRNACIQLVNFWPDVELDEYLKLKDRVENRMRGLVLASTGDDDYVNEDEKGDLEYRTEQLRRMQTEVVDLEDVNGGVSITDLGLNEFRMDLVAYHKANPEIDHLPAGINAVVEGDEPGYAFVLRNVKASVAGQGRNPLHPFYLVYVNDAGEVMHGYLRPKETLDLMRKLCRGKTEPDRELCRAYNRVTKNGRDMREASEMLRAAVGSIVEQKATDDVASLFTAGPTSFLENDVTGLDDFELVCFVAVRPHA